jgi:hypothetical protein
MKAHDRAFAKINQAEYIYMRSLTEPTDNQLEMVIEEAVLNEARRGKINSTHLPPDLQFLVEGGAPIETTESCLAFRLFWKNYAAYLVTEECVGSCGKDDYEEYQGERIWIYSKSHFLEHLARDTGAHTAPLIHYKVTCLNHLVDVAATEPPTIEEITL